MLKIYVTLLGLLCAIGSYGQSQLDSILKIGTEDDKNKLITDSAFKIFLYKRFDAISGTEVKKGKVLGNSATIDEKSVTLNLSFATMLNRLYLQPTVSATPKKGFLSVFEQKEFSSTISAGMNFQFFLSGNSGNFLREKRVGFHNQLRAVRQYYLLVEKPKWEQGLQVFADSLKSIVQRALKKPELASLIKDIDKKPLPILTYPAAALEDKKKYDKLVDTLTKTKILNEAFVKKSFSEQETDLDGVLKHPDGYYPSQLTTARHLGRMDSLQFAAPFNKTTIHWLSGGLSYNHERQDVLDPGSDNVTRAARNEYIKANLAYNFLQTYASGARNYFTVTVSYGNGRDYREKLKTTVQHTTTYPINGNAMEKVVKTYSFFEKTQPRVNVPGAEFTYVRYQSKSNLGFEFSVKGSLNDVDDDNLGGRIGVFIPVGEKDKKPILIEPLVRFQKLAAKIDDFWKENFVIGFNVSVKLGKFLF